MKFSCRFSLAGAYDEAPARAIGIGLVGAENVRHGAGNVRLPSQQEVDGEPAPKAIKLRKPDRRGRPVETHRQHGRTANHIWRHARKSGRRSPMTAHATRRKGALLQRFMACHVLSCGGCARRCDPVDPLFSVRSWRRIPHVHANHPCPAFLSFPGSTGMELALTGSTAALRNSMDVICQSLASREKQA